MTLYLVFGCDLGWMNKGGPEGEYWPEGRYYIESRDEPDVYIDKWSAKSRLSDRAKNYSGLYEDKVEDFYCKYERKQGIKVGMKFFYMKEVQTKDTVDPE